ncbi:hypothetical protein Ddc_19881 [Ditylenchus destructor]|nr:hypothetical protein Ddc_19881 [Ditylenchus destructor]
MTLVFRNQLSQTATQIRTLLATPPAEWHAEAETRATLALLDLEDQIAVNAEYSESLLNEAARFEDGQRLFLSAFGKLPAASKDAEEKAYDDLLNDIRIDDLHAASRQMVGTISRRIRAYKRQAAELRAQIAQEQTRATINFTLEEHASREGTVLRDILQNMQGMLQALALPQPPGATTPVVPLTTTAPAVSTVTNAATGLTTTAAILGTSQANANDPLSHASVLISSAPGGPFPVSTAPTSMPIYTTTNMGAQATLNSSHWNTPPGIGFGGQHQAKPQYFSSPYAPQAQMPFQDERFRNQGFEMHPYAQPL